MAVEMRSAVLFTCTMALSACASIVSDNDTMTDIQTEPEVARRELSGQDLKRVIHTPHGIELPSSAAPVTVICEAKGYRKTTVKLDTSTDGWIFGNILFGGVVGIALDAPRGAGQRYPKGITLVLEPKRFATVEARDKWFDRRKAAMDEEGNKVLEAIKKDCADGPGDCDRGVEDAEKQRVEELQQLESRRLKVPIGQG